MGSLLQGIFPTQELNQDLLHCRWILYQLSHQGSPSLYCTPLNYIIVYINCIKKKKKSLGIPWRSMVRIRHFDCQGLGSLFGRGSKNASEKQQKQTNKQNHSKLRYAITENVQDLKVLSTGERM